MARDHARVRLDIWTDDDFRALPSTSQWLYFHLISSPSLTFCGVADWRPARIAAVTAELTGYDVEAFAVDLEECSKREPFIVVDRASEEVLVRSFIKHDQLMKQPNMATAMVKAHASTASAILRAVIIDQLVRLRDSEPNLLGWAKLPGGLLRKAPMSATEAIALLPPNPSFNPSIHPSDDPSAKDPLTLGGDFQ